MQNIKRKIRKVLLRTEGYLLSLKSKKDVLFVVHNELMFSYAWSVYENLADDERLRFWFCFISKDGFMNSYRLKKKYAPRTISYKYAKNWRWDLILYPMHGPYFRKSSPKIYLTHSLHAGKLMNGEHYLFGPNSLDENNNVIYDKIFGHSDFVLQKVKKYHPKFYSRIKVVGSLLADQIKEMQFDRKKVFKRLNLYQNRKTILISTSWGSDSLIQKYGDDLLAQIPKLSKKYNIILSLHINNFYKEHSGGKNWKKILRSIKKKGIYPLPPGGKTHEYLPFTDLLLTDFTSLSLYFAMFERPVIFVNGLPHKNDPTGLLQELKRGAYKVQNLKTINRDIEKAIKSFEQKKMNRAKERIFSHLGNAKARFKEEIYDSLKLDGNKC